MIATSGLQLVFAILLVVLGLIVAYNCLKELFGKAAGSIPTRTPSGLISAARTAGSRPLLA